SSLLLKAACGGSLTVTRCWLETARHEGESESLEMVSVTRYVPDLAYLCAAFAPVAVLPSPKSQRQAVILPPLKCDPEPSNWAASVTGPACGARIAATGPAMICTAISSVDVSLQLPTFSPWMVRKARYFPGR